MPPGAQMQYGMRGPPNHFGPRQMMHDPRQSLMQHPSASGAGSVDYPQDAKILKLTKQGSEPKKRGRKSKAELQAMEVGKYPGATQSPPSAHHMHPQMSAMPPSMITGGHPLNSPSHPANLHPGAGGSVPDSMIPTSVLSVQNARLLDPSELGPPGGATSGGSVVEEAPVKKRGRRKKFTPLREDLNKAKGVDLSAASHATAAKSTAPTGEAGSEPKVSSILSDRLTGKLLRSRFRNFHL